MNKGYLKRLSKNTGMYFAGGAAFTLGSIITTWAVEKLFGKKEKPEAEPQAETKA